MKYPVIYIKGKGSHTARFSEMVEGRMYVVGDIGSAMRTLTSLRTDHAFILYEQRDPAAPISGSSIRGRAGASCSSPRGN